MSKKENLIQEVKVKFAWDSGNVMQFTESRFTNNTALLGIDLTTFPDFTAEVRATQETLPSASGFQLRFSSDNIDTLNSTCDILVAMNATALKVNLRTLKPGGIIIVNTGGFDRKELRVANYPDDVNPLEDNSLKGFEVIKMDVTKMTRDALKDVTMGMKEKDRAKNMFVLGFLYWKYNRDMEKAVAFLTQKFGKKDEILDSNIKALQAGFDYGISIETLQTKESVINSFDVWTDAQGIKSKTRVKGIDNISFEGIVRLREFILELAVQGKLVSQNKDSTSADELIKTIIKDKELLIQKGLLRREKDLPEISDKEKLFDIPENWGWVRLGIIGTTNIGLTYSPNDVSNNGLIVLRSSNIQNGKIDLADLVRVNKKVDEKVLVEKGDLLICARNGSKQLVGKCALIKSVTEQMAFGAFMAIYRYKFNNYIKVFIESPIYRRNLEGVSTTTINQITQDNLRNTIIPLPPLDEQERIVAKVGELMSLCDELENQQTRSLSTHQTLVKTFLETLTQAADADELQSAWEKISFHFDTLFSTEDSIDQLKQTILQLAVMGRLAKQDFNDEPASELLKKIQIKKEELVNEGIIRKDHLLTDVSDEEKPFLIPENWQWVRLGNITNKIGSGSTPRGGRESYSHSGIVFLRSQNIRDEGLLLDDVVNIDEATNEKMSNTIVHPFDILLNITGGSLGRSTVFPTEAKTANVSQHVTIIRPTITESCFYLHLCILSPYIQNLIWGRQIGANREGLSKKILEQFEIPYPPLQEQIRIFEKITSLFKLCDLLDSKIKNVQELKNSLSKTIIENAVV